MSRLVVAALTVVDFGFAVAFVVAVFVLLVAADVFFVVEVVGFFAVVAIA